MFWKARPSPRPPNTRCSWPSKEKLTFVHPFDDDEIIAGQGTIALELLAAHPDIEALVIPVGGGGLIAGNAIAAKAIKPGIEVIGVEAQCYPGLNNALKGDNLPVGGQTIAEGIAVERIGERPLAIARELVDDVILVGEAHLEAAVNLLLSAEKPWPRAPVPRHWRRFSPRPPALRANAWGWSSRAATSMPVFSPR